MIKILVVEDDRDKLRSILSGLLGIPGIDERSIYKARDANEAKQWLRREDCDLMILDIAIPETSDLEPSPDGGLRLLEELTDRDIYKVPRDIIGLTAFTESRNAAFHIFDKNLWHVLHYTANSNDWFLQLQRRVKHLISSQKSFSEKTHFADICILTALHSPELVAVLRLPWEWHDYIVDGDPTQYHRGTVQTSKGPLTVLAAHSSRMGMSAAASLSTKMILTFKPKYIAMVGIAAGILNQVEPGDIIAADPCWDYGSGKKSSSDSGPFFEPAPHQLALDPFIRPKLLRLSQDAATINEIRLGWPSSSPPLLSLKVGPLATGSAVLEDPTVTAAIKVQHRKVLGVEMEAYGVFAAASEAPSPQPAVIVLKSVCDFANSHKNDDYQSYAAYTSAQAIKIFFERFL